MFIKITALDGKVFLLKEQNISEIYENEIEDGTVIYTNDGDTFYAQETFETICEKLQKGGLLDDD